MYLHFRFHFDTRSAVVTCALIPSDTFTTMEDAIVRTVTTFYARASALRGVVGVHVLARCRASSSAGFILHTVLTLHSCKMAFQSGLFEEGLANLAMG